MTVSNKTINKTPFIVVGVISLIVSIIYFTFVSHLENKKALIQAHKQEYKTKAMKLSSRKFDFVCNKQIIRKRDYFEVINIRDDYRVILKQNSTNIDDSINIDDCDIINQITSEVKTND